MIRTTTMTLVTVVCEGLLEERIVAELHELGARGHTITDVRGEGTRGVHASDWEGEVKIETIVPPEVAARMLEHLAGTYFAQFAVIAYAADVRVVRPAKYAG